MLTSFGANSGLRTHHGLTLLEIVLVVAVLGILSTLAFVALRPPAARLYSTDVRTTIQQARFEAIKRNIPVAVVWDAASETFEVRTDLGATPTFQSACTSATVLRSKATAEYPPSTVSAPANFGIAWLPSGQGRTCTGASISNIVITDGRTTRTVSVSTSGSVTLQ